MTALLIDGRLVAGGSDTFDSINPATEEPIGPAADGDAADMDRAIGAAFPHTPPMWWSARWAYSANRSCPISMA